MHHHVVADILWILIFECNEQKRIRTILCRSHQEAHYNCTYYKTAIFEEKKIMSLQFAAFLSRMCCTTKTKVLLFLNKVTDYFAIYLLISWPPQKQNKHCNIFFYYINTRAKSQIVWFFLLKKVDFSQQASYHFHARHVLTTTFRTTYTT